MPTASHRTLEDVELPPGLPHNIVAIVGENENGTLRVHSQALMQAVVPYGLIGHVVDLSQGGWTERLADLIQAGVLLAWGGAGVGARLTHPDGPLWDVVGVPFLSVMADSPCQMPGNHAVPAANVANAYIYPDWLDMQRRLIRSPQISALVRHGVAPNPARDQVPWSRRPHRMVFVKTGSAPERRRAGWAELPHRFRAVLEESAAAVLQHGVVTVAEPLLACLEAHGLVLDGRTDVLFGLMYQLDQYVRDVRSTAMATAMLNLPVDIIGAGWDHLDTRASRARFHAALDAATLPALFAETQFVVNTMPNFARGTHERVANGFAARSCVVTNENADMSSRFGALPSYFGVSTEAEALSGQLDALFHGREAFDDQTQPALDLVEAEFTAEGFMCDLIELSLEVRAAARYAAFKS